MNRILLFALTVGTSLSINAQKVTDTEISFDYTRLPTEPVGKDIKNYQSKVVLTYANANDASSKAYEQTCAEIKAKNAQDCIDAKARYEDDKNNMEKRRAEAQKNYEMEMQVYKEQDELAEARYQKELEEYNKQSTAKILLTEQKKPVRAYVAKPQLRTPSEPYLAPCPDPVYPPKPDMRNIQDPNVLAASYIKLDGFKNQADNAVKIEVTLHGFEANEPELKSTSSKNSQGQVTNTYWYETSCKHPMSVKVTKPDGSTPINESVEQYASYTVIKTKSGSQPGGLIGDKTAYLKKIEDDMITRQLNSIDSMLDSRIGFTTIKRNTVLYSVETGKMNYDDYKKAYDLAFIAYNKMTSDPAQAKAKLTEAIAIWETAMGESNPNDKKARVDKDVTMITLLNLIEALTFLDEYSRAEDHVIKLRGMDLSRRETRAMESLAKLMEDRKLRFQANQ